MKRPASDRTAVSTGATIAGRYRLVRLLGEGGMGQVWEAEHLVLGSPFALKILRLEKWSEELLQRFGREARALAKVSSPRVARVTDSGIEEAVGPFFVMEMVQGGTLRQRLTSGPLPHTEARRLAHEICLALADIHSAGIVHRDLKPSNIALLESGPVGVKLLDFGLAASVDDSYLSRITQSHQVLGSLPYMAPEQFHGARPTPSLDLYALGVVLHEALTGRVPFHAPTPAALIHQVLAAPTPPMDSSLAVPADLQSVVARLLGKGPDSRYRSADEVAQALGRDATPLPSTLPSRPPLPPTRSVPHASHATPVPSPTPVPSTAALAPGSSDSAHRPSAPTCPPDAHALSEPSLGMHPPATAIPHHPTHPGAARGRGVLGLMAVGLGAAVLTAIVMVLLLRAATDAAEVPTAREESESTSTFDTQTTVIETVFAQPLPADPVDPIPVDQPPRSGVGPQGTAGARTGLTPSAPPASAGRRRARHLRRSNPTREATTSPGTLESVQRRPPSIRSSPVPPEVSSEVEEPAPTPWAGQIIDDPDLP